MQNWPLEEARRRIAALVDDALAKGPQRVTRHGKSAVVVVSEAEWRRVTENVPSFGKLLATFPAARGDLPRGRPARVLRKRVFG